MYSTCTTIFHARVQQFRFAGQLCDEHKLLRLEPCWEATQVDLPPIHQWKHPKTWTCTAALGAPLRHKANRSASASSQNLCQNHPSPQLRALLASMKMVKMQCEPRAQNTQCLIPRNHSNQGNLVVGIAQFTMRSKILEKMCFTSVKVVTWFMNAPGNLKQKALAWVNGFSCRLFSAKLT